MPYHLEIVILEGKRFFGRLFMPAETLFTSNSLRYSIKRRIFNAKQ